MKLIHALLFVLTVAVITARGEERSEFTPGEVEKTLHTLDRELDNRAHYMEQRQAGIDSVRLERLSMKVNSPEWLDATMEIGVRYGTFNNDSALVYLDRGIRASAEVGDEGRLAEFRMQAAVALARGGMLSDAISLRSQVDSTRLAPAELASFFNLGRQMYSYISTHYETLPEKYAYWRDMSVEAQKSLLPLMPKDTNTYRRNLGEYYMSVGEYAKARETLTELLDTLTVDDPEYAIVSHVLADIAHARGDNNAFIYYLALSAISDVRRANCEVTSLQELGGALFEKGDTHRAHEYLTVAMANAVDSRASARMLRTTELLNIVESDHLQQVHRYEVITTCVIAILVVMTLLLAALIWYLRKQLAHVSALKETLQEASRSKDMYLSQFITLCSAYMDRLRDFIKLVNRKISAGQSDELLALTKSGKFVEEHSHAFYEAFDAAFLNIYPSFVDDVNALMRPGEEIITDGNGSLTTALRILAFMRLGVDDAGRIAKALNLSVNTVYAYRNRLRNRAVNRDTFEASVMAVKGL